MSPQRPQGSRTIQGHQTPTVGAAQTPGGGKAGHQDSTDGGLLGQIADMYDADNARLARRASHRKAQRMSDHDELWDLIDDRLPKEGVQLTDLAGDIADAILAAGWRPPARRIETAEDLDALPIDTVIRWADTVEQHIGSGWWITPGTDDHSHSEQIIDVADGNEIVVLLTPQAENGDTE